MPWHPRRVRGQPPLAPKPGRSPCPEPNSSGAPGLKGHYRGDYDKIIDTPAKWRMWGRPDRAVIQVESGFDPRARSSKGAMGLMQLMPGTAADLGVRSVQNIYGGVAYCASCSTNARRTRLAAYNAGPDAVDRYRYQIPPSRDAKYVNKVKDRTEVNRSRSRHRGRLPPFAIIDGRKIVTGYQDYPPQRVCSNR
jgi:soluble lytic murein transglycosylase-like protein